MSVTVEREPSDRVFSGCSFAVEEIVVARLALPFDRLTHEIAALQLAFTARNPVEVKLACERLSDVARDVARGAGQIQALASSMAQTFHSHVNRRARL